MKTDKERGCGGGGMQTSMNNIVLVFQSNSSVHRSGLLAEVHMRKLESDNHFRLRGETLRKAIEEDKAKGLIPFFVSIA